MLLFFFSFECVLLGFGPPCRGERGLGVCSSGCLWSVLGGGGGVCVWGGYRRGVASLGPLPTALGLLWAFLWVWAVPRRWAIAQERATLCRGR